MSLIDFLRVNLPYVIKRNEQNEWYGLNREYLPLGFNNKNKRYLPEDYPIATQYVGITEKRLLKIAGTNDAIRRDDKGNIITIYLYDDKTNPADNSKLWDDYSKKLKLLSAFKRGKY